jgi:hypothetical protein
MKIKFEEADAPEFIKKWYNNSCWCSEFVTSDTSKGLTFGGESVKSYSKEQIDGAWKAYEKYQRHDGSTRGLAVELDGGIYAVKTGNKSKWFTITPYQYNKRTFQADEVKKVSPVYETSELSTLMLKVPEGFDVILIGIGDD